MLQQEEDSVPNLDLLPNNVEEDESSFYSTVLPDFQAIHMHRAISMNFITLHIKSLPVGQVRFKKYFATDV
ncbi:hypothetical protein PHPALM_20377 [Phytophthora palmivora]|uniref:Uncharacterized protein n=1 Tax=Phytophthora palmivora TaxID=4796 RepID=A0A2P4XF19_9STRA|nr:hypothetical protein PHPALM_20377 [Phytophthora palmivora]